MSRRCVVCGKESAENAPDGAHYHPRNKKEALIWQRSMGATDTSVEDIQKCCCVCIEHIPQFVVRAQEQASLNKDISKSEKNSHEAKSSKNAVHKFEIRGPSLNVLLLPGAVTLPPHCEKFNGKTSENDENQEDVCLDEEIYVKESSYANCCAILADMDETEVTVLQTPTHNDDDLRQEHNAEYGDNNCTDVLVLGQRSSDKCPYRCEQCSKMAYSPNDSAHIPYNLPPLGDENGTKIHKELSDVILRQQQRIYELEVLVGRQNNWQLSLQQKINELNAEFGRVDMQQELTQIASNSMHSEPIEQLSSQPKMTTGGSVQWYSQRSLAHEQSKQPNCLNGSQNTIMQSEA
ncbi:uncharacterized protein LOC6563657 [Drosophila grimshawi]|uniref:GH18749 n=1 Tax=Drosophila grimshawi TaxID=7222 RepID=B4JGC6_DROGR|nr:uncharacterized protein LOC6563657 [Drosophila grimshawi]EDV92595.1 GH18749 [Drosophila grimshawi]